MCMEAYAHTHSDIYTVNMHMYVHTYIIYINYLVYICSTGEVYCTLTEVLKCLNLALLMRFL